MKEREFFTGGMETISTALRSKTLYILHNPDIQKRMRKKWTHLMDKQKLTFCEEVCNLEMLSQQRVKKTTAC